jgi:hypothetical protein
MGRSKNLHFVQHTIEITQPNDPSANWAEGYIQVDKVLSEELGRTIRNGNSYRLVGYGANLKGFTGSADQDIGFAGTAAVNFCPVTKNSVGAWQSLQKQWMKQKALASAVGKYVRYDDFELGWSSATPLVTGRNSTIRMGGLNDTSEELVGLYGSSIDGTYVSLETYYDNLNPIPAASEDPFGARIKEAKFENKFPDQKTLIMPTSFSAQAFDSLTPHGGIANGDISWLPSDNHVSHLTGTLFWYFKGVTPDVQFVADELKLTITLVYEGWAPLAKVRSAKPTTRITNKPAKKTTNARRRS